VKRGELVTRLKAVRSRLVQRIVQPGAFLQEDERSDFRARILFLEEQIRDLRQGENKDKTLFISHSEDLLYSNLTYVRTVAEREFAFYVRTGFDYSNIGNILKRVRTGIDETACFLSIMTPRYQVIDQTSTIRTPVYAPSTWVIEEKGMALALGKPFHLLISRQIHSDFWQKTSPDLKHTVFDDADFEQRSGEALDALNERYTEMVLEQALLH
jgi:hypothetical protein